MYLTPLFTIAGNGDASMVQLLINHGARKDSLDGKGRSPLDIAKEKRHQAVVDILTVPAPVVIASSVNADGIDPVVVSTNTRSTSRSPIPPPKKNSVTADKSPSLKPKLSPSTSEGGDSSVKAWPKGSISSIGHPVALPTINDETIELHLSAVEIAPLPIIPTDDTDNGAVPVTDGDDGSDGDNSEGEEEDSAITGTFNLTQWGSPVLPDADPEKNKEEDDGEGSVMYVMLSSYYNLAYI